MYASFRGNPTGGYDDIKGKNVSLGFRENQKHLNKPEHIPEKDFLFPDSLRIEYFLIR